MGNPKEKAVAPMVPPSPSTHAPANQEEILRILREEAWVRRLVRSLLSSDEGAEELLQRVQTIALTASVREPRPWIARVIRNQAFRFHRTEKNRKKRERAAAREETLVPETTTAEREETRARLLEFVRELEQPYRAAVEICYLEGLTPLEAGERLEIPSATVRTHLRRGLAQLREKLAARYGKQPEKWVFKLLPLSAIRDLLSAPEMLPTPATASARIAKVGAAKGFSAWAATWVAGVPLLLAGGTLGILKISHVGAMGEGSAAPLIAGDSPTEDEAGRGLGNADSAVSPATGHPASNPTSGNSTQPATGESFDFGPRPVAGKPQHVGTVGADDGVKFFGAKGPDGSPSEKPQKKGKGKNKK